MFSELAIFLFFTIQVIFNINILVKTDRIEAELEYYKNK